MHPTKELLLKRNGMRCMLCGKKYKYEQLEWHHIKWKSISKIEGHPIDNSYSNGAILCIYCHRYVHTFAFNSCKYNMLMQVVQNNKV